jgi:hypothetical protein
MGHPIKRWHRNSHIHKCASFWQVKQLDQTVLDILYLLINLTNERTVEASTSRAGRKTELTLDTVNFAQEIVEPTLINYEALFFFLEADFHRLRFSIRAGEVPIQFL